MMLRKTVSPVFLAFTLFGLCWSFIAWSEDLKGLHLDDSTRKNRVALIIGNANYSTAPLKNSVNDARAMAQAYYERLASTALAFIYLAAAAVLLKRLKAPS